MMNNDEKANQVPVFILQDKQAFNYHYYLDIYRTFKSMCVILCQDVQPCM